MKRKDIKVGMAVFVESSREWDKPVPYENGREALPYIVEDTRALKMAGRLRRDYTTGEVKFDDRPEFTTEAGETIKGFALADTSHKTRWLNDDPTTVLLSYMGRDPGDGETIIKRYTLARLGEVRGEFDVVYPALVEADKKAYAARLAERALRNAETERWGSIVSRFRAAALQPVYEPYKTDRIVFSHDEAERILAALEGGK